MSLNASEKGSALMKIKMSSELPVGQKKLIRMSPSQQVPYDFLIIQRMHSVNQS
jgi:hypothetical protein